MIKWSFCIICKLYIYIYICGYTRSCTHVLWGNPNLWGKRTQIRMLHPDPCYPDSVCRSFQLKLHPQGKHPEAMKLLRIENHQSNLPVWVSYFTWPTCIYLPWNRRPSSIADPQWPTPRPIVQHVHRRSQPLDGGMVADKQRKQVWAFSSTSAPKNGSPNGLA